MTVNAIRERIVVKKAVSRTLKGTGRTPTIETIETLWAEVVELSVSARARYGSAGLTSVTHQVRVRGKKTWDYALTTFEWRGMTLRPTQDKSDPGNRGRWTVILCEQIHVG